MDEVSLNTEQSYDDEAEEYDIDGEYAMTEYVGQTGNILQGENPLPPSLGMEFESYNDVYYFYNCYAKQQGFGVRVSNTWYRKQKERYRAKFSCSSAGFKKKTEANRPRPETRTGCPAMIKFKLMDNNRWRIIEIELEHNHLTGLASGSFYKPRRITDLGSKRPLLIDEVCKVKLFRTVVIDEEDNGSLNIDRGDNKLKLKHGDAREMLEFFTRMQLSSPSFFYVTDINGKGCLRNVFWAETRCRAAYGYFGDVVFIDTKTLSEKYEVPLVVFACMNHHMQMVPLGCGLVSGQSVESFVWLFRAWLTYMVGRAPQTIITSLCESLQNAISEVFPRAFHCLSLTNIKEKIRCELVGLEEFEPEFTRIIYRSLRVDEFEASWEDMVKTYWLENHKWLRTLYEDRKRWAPLYLKDVFLAGVFPIKENERLASPFEAYLSPHTSLKEFLSTYDRALLEIEQREKLSDIESRNSSCMLKSRFSFELQLEKTYTKALFEKFQDEVEGMYSCFSVREIIVDGSSVIYYIVKEDIIVEGTRRLTREFEVMYNTCDAEILCACGLFNLRGYLCRHALSVINEIGLEEIPHRYVLERWRKDIDRDYVFNHGCNNNNGIDIDIDNPLHRYDDLYKCVVKVVDEGRRSHDRFKFVSQSLDQLVNKVRVHEDFPTSLL